MGKPGLTAACLALALSLLTGCSTVPVSKARLYNFNNDMLSTARLYELDKSYGRIEVRLPDGERLRGEFTLTGEHPPDHTVPKFVMLQFDESLPGRKAAERPSVLAPLSLARVFGYKRDDDARPVAVASAVGGRSTALEIIFYTLDTRRGQGIGIAHDNHGNWYLVRLGI